MKTRQEQQKDKKIFNNFIILKKKKRITAKTEDKASKMCTVMSHCFFMYCHNFFFCCLFCALLPPSPFIVTLSHFSHLNNDNMKQISCLGKMLYFFFYFTEKVINSLSLTHSLTYFVFLYPRSIYIGTRKMNKV